MKTFAAVHNPMDGEYTIIYKVGTDRGWKFFDTARSAQNAEIIAEALNELEGKKLSE